MPSLIIGLLLAGLTEAAISVGEAPVPSSVKLSPGIAGFEDLRLQSQIFGNLRMIRVFLPTGYADPANSERRYPVFYFLDGIAAFAEGGWNVPGGFSRLLKDGKIQPWIVVGIDNGGSTIQPAPAHPAAARAGEYLPWPDETWTEKPLPDPMGERFPAFLQEEVMPLVNGRFRTLARPDSTGLAGDSFAGLVAVYFVCKRPGVIGRLYLQSPSLHVAGSRILEEARKTPIWPQRIYLSSGTEEGPTRSSREAMMDNLRTLSEIIRRSDPSVALQVSFTKRAGHNYDAFRGQLPSALQFLLGPGRR